MVDIIALVTMALGAIVWAVRLEGRIDNHEQLFKERDRLYDVRDGDIKARLVRIEVKLDRLRTPPSSPSE